MKKMVAVCDTIRWYLWSKHRTLTRCICFGSVLTLSFVIQFVSLRSLCLDLGDQVSFALPNLHWLLLIGVLTVIVAFCSSLSHTSQVNTFIIDDSNIRRNTQSKMNNGTNHNRYTSAADVYSHPSHSLILRSSLASSSNNKNNHNNKSHLITAYINRKILMNAMMDSIAWISLCALNSTIKNGTIISLAFLLRFGGSLDLCSFAHWLVHLGYSQLGCLLNHTYHHHRRRHHSYFDTYHHTRLSQFHLNNDCGSGMIVGSILQMIGIIMCVVSTFASAHENNDRDIHNDHLGSVILLFLLVSLMPPSNFHSQSLVNCAHQTADLAAVANSNNHNRIRINRSGCQCACVFCQLIYLCLCLVISMTLVCPLCYFARLFFTFSSHSGSLYLIRKHDSHLKFVSDIRHMWNDMTDNLLNPIIHHHHHHHNQHRESCGLYFVMFFLSSLMIILLITIMFFRQPRILSTRIRIAVDEHRIFLERRNSNNVVVDEDDDENDDFMVSSLIVSQNSRSVVGRIIGDDDNDDDYDRTAEELLLKSNLDQILSKRIRQNWFTLQSSLLLSMFLCWMLYSPLFYPPKSEQSLLGWMMNAKNDTFDELDNAQRGINHVDLCLIAALICTGIGTVIGLGDFDSTDNDAVFDLGTSVEMATVRSQLHSSSLFQARRRTKSSNINSRRQQRRRRKRRKGRNSSSSSVTETSSVNSMNFELFRKFGGKLEAWKRLRFGRRKHRRGSSKMMKKGRCRVMIEEEEESDEFDQHYYHSDDDYHQKRRLRFEDDQINGRRIRKMSESQTVTAVGSMGGVSVISDGSPEKLERKMNDHRGMSVNKKKHRTYHGDSLLMMDSDGECKGYEISQRDGKYLMRDEDEEEDVDERRDTVHAPWVKPATQRKFTPHSWSLANLLEIARSYAANDDADGDGGVTVVVGSSMSSSSDHGHRLGYHRHSPLLSHQGKRNDDDSGKGDEYFDRYQREKEMRRKQRKRERFYHQSSKRERRNRSQSEYDLDHIDDDGNEQRRKTKSIHEEKNRQRRRRRHSYHHFGGGPKVSEDGGHARSRGRLKDGPRMMDGSGGGDEVRVTSFVYSDPLKEGLGEEPGMVVAIGGDSLTDNDSGDEDEYNLSD